MVTLVTLPTGFVRKSSDATELVPWGTVSGLGVGTAAGLLLVKVTCAPPTGANPSSVIIPAVSLPPFTGLGLNESSFGLGASTLMAGAFSVPPYVTVSMTLVSTGTGFVR